MVSKYSTSSAHIPNEKISTAVVITALATNTTEHNMGTAIGMAV